MAQTWHDLLFAHWPVSVELLRPLVPASLEIDTYEGQAWVGVIPFRMTGVRLHGFPPLPGLSAFPELNVRTYVTVAGKPGVFFFSLDAGNRIAVAAARRWYQLPYFHARMTVRLQEGWIHYVSRRVCSGPSPADFIGRYRPTGDVYRAERGLLQHWLTERYRLYTLGKRQQLSQGDIHHLPWPLQTAEAEFETNTMAMAQGIRLPKTAPLLYFARRLEVVVWPMRPLRAPNNRSGCISGRQISRSLTTD